MPFTTIGETSRRLQVIEYAGQIEDGEVIRYEELEALLGGELQRAKIQQVVNQAKQGLQKTYKKSLEAVPTIGYRVLLPGEHIHLSRHHQKKGRRQTRRSKSAVVNTDYTQLTELERVKYDIASATIRALEQFERRADLRYASRERVESFIREQSSKSARTDDDVASVKDRLARLEALVRERRGDAAAS